VFVPADEVFAEGLAVELVFSDVFDAAVDAQLLVELLVEQLEVLDLVLAG